MTDFSTVLTALQRYPNPIDIFAETLLPELVEEALSSTTGTTLTRRRKFPAKQVVWAMDGLALYGNRSIKNVFDTLGLEINGKVVSSSVSDAPNGSAQPLSSIFFVSQCPLLRRVRYFFPRRNTLALRLRFESKTR